MIRTPRYQVVSTFLSINRPFARPAHFSNKAVAVAFAKKNGHTAVVIDRKLNKKVYTRGLTKV
jgi:ribosomal protein L31E